MAGGMGSEWICRKDRLVDLVESHKVAHAQALKRTPYLFRGLASRVGNGFRRWRTSMMDKIAQNGRKRPVLAGVQSLLASHTCGMRNE